MLYSLQQQEELFMQESRSSFLRESSQKKKQQDEIKQYDEIRTNRPRNREAPSGAFKNDTKRKKTSSSKKEKNVTFNETVKVRRTITLDDFTEEEMSASWFRQKEYEMIRGKIITLVHKVERDGANIGNRRRYCMRGLESMTRLGSQRKDMIRSQAANAVFTEQHMQHLLLNSDEVAIANAYSTIARNCQARASVVGLIYQKEAEKCFL